ncbi:MAG: DUF4493 domain-containing protein [Alistipes indistinctus]
MRFGQLLQTDAENGLVPTLLYPKDSTGFFLLPEGTSNLSWCFSGESSDPDVNKNNTKTGKIELPQGGMQYTLNFRYSKTPDGYLTVVVKVQEYVNVFDDSFIFSPEPSVMGDGFSIGGVAGYYSDPVKFNVASINPLSSLKFTAKSTSTTYEVLHDGQSAARSGRQRDHLHGHRQRERLAGPDAALLRATGGRHQHARLRGHRQRQQHGQSLRPRSRRQTGGDCRAGPDGSGLPT